MTILFHGPSGSGKDTQVDLLVEKYGFEKIGTGEMFRRMYSEGDEDAIEAHGHYSKGRFVPNELTYRMFSKWLEKFDQKKNWAFVSVVRDIGQVKLFDNLLKQKDRELDSFVHFVLDEEIAVERRSLRWTCANCGLNYHEKHKPEEKKGFCDSCGKKLMQREDDSPEMTRKLLGEYNRTIKPIVDEYRSRGVLMEVDASPTIEEIHEEVIKLLDL